MQISSLSNAQLSKCAGIAGHLAIFDFPEPMWLGAYSVELNVIDGDGGVTLVTLVGALDVSGMQSIDLKFQSSVAPRRQPTILDMSGVSFISSLGMGMLVAAATSLRRNGKKMVILKPQPNVGEALRHSRIDKIIPIVDSMSVATEIVIN